MSVVDTKPHNAYYERPATLSLLPVKQADPEDYEELMARPTFLCIRARKTGDGGLSASAPEIFQPILKQLTAKYPR